MDAVQVPGGTVLVGKNRNPIGVIVLSVITLGVYWLYWYYQVNDEVRRHEPQVQCSPGVALLAQFVPFAHFVSHYNTGTRIQRMELADGMTSTISPLVTFLLLVFFGIGYVVQVQSHLNAHWDGHRFTLTRTERQTMLGATAASAANALPVPDGQRVPVVPPAPVASVDRRAMPGGAE
jgi:hypothetical protein